MRNLILVVAVVAVGAGGWMWLGGSGDITNAEPRGETIVALGDSLTAGHGAPAGEGYVDELSRRLRVPIINSGIGGDTTAGGLSRLDRDVLAHNPRIVILCLGGNDLMRQRPNEEIFGNLRQIITRVQDRGALVILVGLSGSIFRPDFESRFENLADELGCPYVPNILGGIIGNTSLMADQIHPNAAGYDRMADKIEPVVREYL